MKRSKKLLGIFLSVVMVFSVIFSFSIVANAETQTLSGKCGENATYEFNTQTGILIVKGEGALSDGSDIFDDSIESNTKELVIENGITQIGTYNFMDFINLKYVTLPDTLVTINDNAFDIYIGYENVFLERINIPTSVKYIGDCAINIPVIRLISDYDFNVNNPDLNVAERNYGLDFPLMVLPKEEPVGEWVENEDGSRSFLQDGVAVTNTELIIDGSLYSFDELGKARVGFYNGRYYDIDGSLVYAKWLFIDDNWKYIDIDGYQVTDDIIEFYKEMKDSIYYLDEQGNMINDGWNTITRGGKNEYDIFAYPSGVLSCYEWIKDRSGNLVYTDYNGCVIKNDITYTNKGPMRFDKDGYLMYGWYDISEDPSVPDWRYSDENGIVVEDAWVTDSHGWLYLNGAGKITKNRFRHDSVGTLYLGEDGYPVTGWFDLGSEQYPEWHFSDENGYEVCERWVMDSVGWVYLNYYGEMATDCFAEDSHGLLFVGSDGYIVTNRLVSDELMIESYGEKRYGYPMYLPTIRYAGGDGYMVKGWQYVVDEYHDINDWMYFDNEFSLVIDDWVMDSQGWCFVDENGVMVTDTVAAKRHERGAFYFVGSDGHIVGEGWHCEKYENTWVYTNQDGQLVENGWFLDSTGWCYVDNYCMTQNNWISYNGVLYYADNNGHIYKSTAVEIDGKLCAFDENGQYMPTGDSAIV